ncbi:MAG: phosphoribosyl-AMP cyclohydrolase [Eubacteriales bacterium]|nr:phosphoribosyl-AMP cyclohydrolase [Eubacteriales bacterium]
MIDIDELVFDDRGLIPAIVQDATSKRVLTVAYMNRESLDITLKEGKTCFWSRHRKVLWRKGETSGNFQHVVSIIADCDRDALVVIVNKDGPACHMGTDSCFEYPLVGDVDKSAALADVPTDELMAELKKRMKAEGKSAGDITEELVD